MDYFSIILGMSSSQLTLTPSFFRGVGLNHQPDILQESPKVRCLILPSKKDHNPPSICATARQAQTAQPGFGEFARLFMTCLAIRPRCLLYSYR